MALTLWPELDPLVPLCYSSPPPANPSGFQANNNEGGAPAAISTFSTRSFVGLQPSHPPAYPLSLPGQRSGHHAAPLI